MHEYARGIFSYEWMHNNPIIILLYEKYIDIVVKMAAKRRGARHLSCVVAENIYYYPSSETLTRKNLKVFYRDALIAEQSFMSFF